MPEEKKYPEGNPEDQPTIAMMKIQIEDMKLDIFLLKTELLRMQRCVFPVIEELEAFGLKISNPTFIKKGLAGKPPLA